VDPLVNQQSYDGMQSALAQAKDEGGEVLVGGNRVLADHYPDAYYVEPAIVRMPAQTDAVKDETFAPMLDVLSYSDLAEALELHNGVPQGLSSSIFTSDQTESVVFLSARGSDCGIANVNIGT